MAGDALTVIDLGEDFAPRTGERSRPRGRGKDGAPRPLAILLAVLLLVAGAGPGNASGFVQLARVPAATSDSYQLFDDGLYVWDARQPRTQTQISRYDLDGRLRWQRLVAGYGPQTFVLETDHETIVDANLVDGESHIMGLDRRTGAVLWDQIARYGNGYPFIETVDPHGRLLVYEAGNRGSRLRWVDTHSGRDVWKLDVAPGWAPDFQENATLGSKQWLVSVGGQVMGVTLDDRGRRLSATLPGLGRAAGLDYRTVVAGEGMLIVTDVNGAFPEQQYVTLHAYDEHTFAHKWDEATGHNADISFCGEHICETSNLGLSVVEPATGRHLWSTASQMIYPTGSNLIIGPYSPTGEGRQTIVRAGSGRPLADMTSWSFVQVGQSSWSFVHGGRSPLLLIQPTHGFPGVWVAWLRPGDTQPLILGALSGMSMRCVATLKHIACHAMDGTIVLWRTS